MTDCARALCHVCAILMRTIGVTIGPASRKLASPQTGVSRVSGGVAMTFGPAPIDPERTYWPFILLIAAILAVMVGALLVFFA